MDSAASWASMISVLDAGAVEYVSLGSVELETSSSPAGISMYLHGSTLQVALSIMELASSRFGFCPAPTRVTMTVDTVGAEVEISCLDTTASRQKLETFYSDVFPLLYF